MNREWVTLFIRPCQKCKERKNVTHVLKGADLTSGTQNSYFKCETSWCNSYSKIGAGIEQAIKIWNSGNGGHSGLWKFLADIYIWRKAILFVLGIIFVIGWASMCAGKVFAHDPNDFDNVVMSGKISVVKVVNTWPHAHLVYEVPAWVEMDSVARAIIEKDMYIIVLPDSSIEYVSRQDNIHVQADVKLRLQ